MGSSVPVRCPACRRDHAYVPPVFPCACGAPLAPPLLRGAPPQPITHRTWTDSWVTVRCPSCGRQDQWPQPELGCGCGTVLRIPVRPAPTVHTRHFGGGGAGGDAPGSDYDADAGARASARADLGTGLDAEPAAAARTAPAHGESGRGRANEDSPAGGRADGDSPAGGRTEGGSPAPPPRPRPPFRPLTIRTARDAVTAAALYLKWLGFRDILQSPEHPASGIDLRARGLVAQVDPRTEPSTLRDVECLWLHGLNSSSLSVFFSLTGYVPEARARAEDLGVPLFVMDLTGTPQPANGAADELVGSDG
ncbi:hypothetical protein [Streptomyces sp. NPDC048442]|uniref:hypothetical protein n=1 Tax=Streptomyces sp. NPDC048442 TaxID=3154823 RepID=UPI00342C8CB0